MGNNRAHFQRMSVRDFDSKRAANAIGRQPALAHPLPQGLRRKPPVRGQGIKRDVRLVMRRQIVDALDRSADPTSRHCSILACDGVRWRSDGPSRVVQCSGIAKVG